MSEPSQLPNPERTPLQAIGGDGALRLLVQHFYDHMDLDPEYALIRALHPPTLDSARDKLYCFLSGWMGGPPLYTEKYGNPMLRARHLPFAIGSRERDQWLACMDQAMRDLGLAEPLRQSLYNAFYSTADWMRNKPGDLPEAITKLHGG